MGIQDDLFDVMDAIDKLEDEGVSEAFERLTTFYGQLEKVHEEQRIELRQIKQSLRLIGSLMR